MFWCVLNAHLVMLPSFNQLSVSLERLFVTSHTACPAVERAWICQPLTGSVQGSRSSPASLFNCSHPLYCCTCRNLLPCSPLSAPPPPPPPPQAHLQAAGWAAGVDAATEQDGQEAQCKWACGHRVCDIHTCVFGLRPWPQTMV